jgi:PhoH-like ATPase
VALLATEADITTGVAPEQRVCHARTAQRPVVILDTSVLLSEPSSLFAFPDADVVLPLTVIEELDGHKGRLDDVGRAARHSARLIEQLRVEAGGDLRQPVVLPRGGSLRIELNGLQTEALGRLGLSVDKADNRILAAALGQVADGRTVRVVSADVNLRLKAASLGLEAEEHRSVPSSPNGSHHRGWRTVEVAPDVIDRLFASRSVALEEAGLTGEQVGINEMAVCRAGRQSALARRVGTTLRLLNTDREVWGLRARNKEQAFALELLLDPELPVVALAGKAGTGKTILALAAALEQTFERNAIYDRVMILRPVVAVGRQQLGYLPGTLEEKLGPWMEAVTDAMVALGDGVSHQQAQDILNGWVRAGKLTMEAVTFLRGRSLQRTFVVVDEAQNLEPLTVKTILTRLGEGSKVVLVGDVTQIDVPGGRSGLVGLDRVLGEVPGIAFVHLTRRDVVRHQIVADIIRAYEEAERADDGG